MRWFGHVQRRPMTAPVRESFAMQVGPPRGRDRSKKTLMDVVKIDLKNCNLFEDLVYDRSEWRNIIHVADPNIVQARL